MSGTQRHSCGSIYGYVPLAAVIRGDVAESVHHGAIAVVDSSGSLLASAGDPDTVTFLRSAAKPVQVLPLLESGAAERFRFTEEEIAVMIGSHGGETTHLDAVRSILKKAGLDQNTLRCGAHAPMHPLAAHELRARGEAPTVLHNNCSGKHAAMLAQAVHLGDPIETYLEPDHPVQVRIRAAVMALADVSTDRLRMAVDGCSAPTFALSIRHAAQMFARLLSPDGLGDGLGEAARRAVAAMRAHPTMIAGTERLCTSLMESTGERLVAKIGAEGFYGLGFERRGKGVGIAIKVADGNGRRARHSVALGVLEGLGLLTREKAHELRSRFVGVRRNRRGLTVGRVETLFDLKMPYKRVDRIR
jgi:L-asparaginase II